MIKSLNAKFTGVRFSNLQKSKEFPPLPLMGNAVTMEELVVVVNQDSKNMVSLMLI